MRAPHQWFASDMFLDRSVVITGGGTGIGLELTRAFAALGANVVVASRKLDVCEAAANEVKALGRRALAIETNVRDYDSVAGMAKRAHQEFGRIDILICNAGANFLCPAINVSPNGFRSIVETVLFGSFYCAKACGEYMVNEGYGRILSLTATNGMNGSPLMMPSGAAKAGVINMMMTLASEWAQFGVTCNSLSPGAVNTNGANSRLWANPEAMKKVTESVPLGRMAVPSDLIGAALFLCSDAGAFITGANLVVDGGEMLRHVPSELM